MNHNYALAAVAIALTIASFDTHANDDPAYPTPPSVRQDINSVDLFSGRYEPELPELGIAAAPRLSFKYLQQFVVRAEARTYHDGGATVYDFTYQGSTSERIKCDAGICASEENYGSFLTGGFETGSPEPGSVAYRQGQTGTIYAYNSKSYFWTSPGTNPGSGDIANIGYWWVGSITYADGESISFDYDIADGSTASYDRFPHRPRKVTSNTGYQIEFTYFSDVWTDSSVEWYQLETATIYKTGEATPLAQFTYTINGTETTVTDLAGRQWTYSGFENTPGVLPAAATTQNYKLELPGNTFDSISTTRHGSGVSQGLISTVTRNGLSYSYNYGGVLNNGTGKVFSNLKITGPMGYQRDLVYGYWGQGHAKQPYVDEEFDSLGYKTSYTYEGRRIKTVTFPEGNKVVYTYDVKGNVTEKRAVSKTPGTTPDIVISADYPSSCYLAGCFKPESVTDGEGNITNYTFADHGGLEERIGPANSLGHRRVTTNEWLQAANGLWRLDSTTECFQHECGTASKNVRITEYTYWGNTNLPQTVTTRTGASGSSSTVTYTYDDAGRVLSEDGPLSGTGDAVYYRYDAAGRKTWEIGPVNDAGMRVAKKLTLRAQDSQPLTIATGTLSSATDTSLSVDTTETIAYTNHGLAKKYTITAGGATWQLRQITYDAGNRVDCDAQRMNPETFGNPPASACSLGTTGQFGPDRITRYEHDTESRITKVTSGYGTANVGIDREASYTDNGQLASLTDGNGNLTQYRYDSHDRLFRVIFADNTFERFLYDDNGNKSAWRKRDGSTFFYIYDASNLLKRTTVPGEAAINYVYDGLGRPTEVNRGDGNITEYGYDNRGHLDRSETNGHVVTYGNDIAGRVKTMTYPNGQIVSYEYDDSNAVILIEAQQHSSAGKLTIAEYEYDTLGRVTDMLLGDGGLTSYEYDDIGRLDRHTLADFNITTLAYNPASQIVTRSVTDNAMQSAMPDSSPSSYTPNNLNQYGAVDGITLDYDDNGNLEDYDTWTYGYDAHNRLTSASRPGTSVTLGYDPTGRLSQTTLAGATTEYAYAGDKLIGEFTTGGNPINLYIYPPGSDIPIARFSGGNGLNDLEYLRSDERGSIVLETDGTALLESHQYDVYGVPLNTSDSLFRYTGQIQIRGTDLYHYKARAYHPNLGRFLQTDPIGYDDGMNMYAYVGNDPVSKVDPNGLEARAIFSPNQEMLLMQDVNNGRYSVSYSWFTGVNGISADQSRGPIPAGSYRILERSGVMDGARAYRLEAIDDNFGDDATGARGLFRLHRGSISLGCVTCQNDADYAEIDSLLQSTSTTTSKVDRKGRLGKIFPTESLIDFGSLEVLPSGLSLKFNSDSGEFRVQGSLSKTGTRIRRKVDELICTVDAEKGTCH